MLFVTILFVTIDIFSVALHSFSLTPGETKSNIILDDLLNDDF